MARSEVNTTCRRIRRQLNSGQRLELGTLATTVDDNDTNIVFSDALPASVYANSMLNIGVEMMRVRSFVTATKTVTVARGAADSEAVAHTAGDEISINPRFSLLDIYDALIAELNSWGPGIYRVEADTFTYATEQQTVELPTAWADCYHVLTVRGKRDVSDLIDATNWTKWPALSWSLVRAPVATLPDALSSGLLLRIPDSSFIGDLYVAAALPLLTDDVPLTADLIEDIGVPASALDVVDMGVRRRLAIDAEMGRSARDAQGDSRAASENPPGGNVSVLRVLDAQYFRRMSEETYKLLSRWPIGMS